MSDINTNDFEVFLQLDDVKGAARETNQQYLEQYREDHKDDYVPEDLSGWKPEDDLEELHDFSDIKDDFMFEDEEGWEDPDASEETDEDVEEDTDEVVEGSDDEVDEGDTEEDNEPFEAYDVDYDTIITLPDGRDMSIEELANGFVAGNDLTTREATLQEHIAQFEERVGSMKDVLQLSQLEADKVISDYEAFDWDTLAATDPQAYVENKRFLERYQMRKAELVAAQAKLQQEADAKEQELYQAQCVECVEVLKKTIPNWDEPLYQSLMQYAIDLGANEEEVLKENRPSIFIALHKAWQFDKGRDRVMAKIKRPGAPKKVIKPGATNPTSQSAQEAGKRAAAAKAYASGKMSQEEAFKFLID